MAMALLLLLLFAVCKRKEDSVAQLRWPPESVAAESIFVPVLRRMMNDQDVEESEWGVGDGPMKEDFFFLRAKEEEERKKDTDNGILFSDDRMFSLFLVFCFFLRLSSRLQLRLLVTSKFLV